MDKDVWSDLGDACVVLICCLSMLAIACGWLQ